MNVTSREKQIQILSALVEGNSIRSTERMIGVHRDTIMRLLVRVGDRCQVLMDEKLQGIHCEKLQLDEIWTFVAKKEGHLKDTECHNSNIGDQFVFVALDPDTKLVPTFVVGKRTKCLFHSIRPPVPT